tara:strand:- start:68 stop:706 length:639 start_codon:yes stop_codon:yes gene_type:complete
MVNTVHIATTPEIIRIFPQCFTAANLGRAITKKEMAACIKYKKTAVPIQNNIASTEQYVLDKEPNLSGIKDFIMSGINYYADTVIAPDVKPDFYITQSWLNWTHKGESHHEHVHPNSFLSGVFYLNVVAGRDEIVFSKVSNSPFSLPSSNYTELNSDSWFWKVNAGDMVLFRSNIPHKVPEIKTDEVRISLAFNVFMRGIIGDYNSSTELVI